MHRSKIAMMAIFLYISGHVSVLHAWNSGSEDAPGPEQARRLLLPWVLFGPPANRSIRNEHGALMEGAFRSVDSDGELLSLTTATYSLPVYVFDGSLPPDYSMKSLLPAPPLEANKVQTRVLNLAGLAGLPDHSFSLWDWATGNEICPIGISQGDASPKECHTLNSHLGAVNSSHFSTQAGAMYSWYHQLAVEGAAQCAAEHDALLNSHLIFDNWDYIDSFWEQCEVYVLALEAIGQHFLQDVWAVGHMWPRWGAPDLREFPLPFQRGSALLAAAASGLIHGCENSVICPFRDDMSSGIDNGYLDPEDLDTPLPGIGDGRLEFLFHISGVYKKQKDRLEACGRSGVAEVWEALGNTAALGERIDPDGPVCLGPRNTYSAIYRGWGLGQYVLDNYEVPSIATYLGGGAWIPYEIEDSFRRDLSIWEREIELIAKGVNGSGNSAPAAVTPEQDETGEGDIIFKRILNVVRNEAITEVPPARYADPRTLIPGASNPTHLELNQGQSVTEESVNSVVVLKRLFNKAHIKTLCSDPENDPLALKHGFQFLQKNPHLVEADALPVALELCTEFAARHLQFPAGEPSMCQLVGADSNYTISNFVHSGSTEGFATPLQAAAAEWCLPFKLTVEKSDLATDSALITNQGLVSSSSGEINCGEICEAHPADELVTLTAEEAGGWKFVKWADDSEVCAGSEVATCEVTMNSDKTAKAVFEPPRCTSTGSASAANSRWWVTCTNVNGDVVLTEEMQLSGIYDTPDEGMYYAIHMKSFLPGDAGFDFKEWTYWNGTVHPGVGNVPFVFGIGPLLIQSELWKLGTDSVRRVVVNYHLRPFDFYLLDQEGNRKLVLLHTHEWIETPNRTGTTTGRHCSVQNGNRSTFYVWVDGTEDLSQRIFENIDAEECPTSAEGWAINSLTPENSLINQCIQMGKTYNNCPLAPLVN